MSFRNRRYSFVENYWELCSSKFFGFSQGNLRFFEKCSEMSFNPYQDNSGTIISISLGDYLIVASDTRFTMGYSIPDRSLNRIIKISDQIVLATAGMQSDIIALQDTIKERVELEFIGANINYTVEYCANFLSTILYSRRFFPYYTFNLLSGLNSESQPKIFSYDAIGSYEENNATCIGSGQKLLQPILDYCFPKECSGFFNGYRPLNEAIMVVKHFFLAISQRGTTTGDGLQIMVITKDAFLIENSFIKID
mmetsp:Transcript_19373/g.30280  ORF Transcript_19373/g.30280 Transcript_19373/m.30280 type:complete len:252 (-) Transcript_19373:3661-4416(-)